MGVPAGDFGKDAWLHARMAIMRGVENGFALVRAANEGLLTASDAEGRLIARKAAASSGMTVLIAALPLGPGATFYTRIGDAFAWCVVILFLGIGGLAGAARTAAAGGQRSRTLYDLLLSMRQKPCPNGSQQKATEGRPELSISCSWVAPARIARSRAGLNWST